MSTHTELVVDVTRPGSQLGHYQLETQLTGVDVTAAPGDCPCHHHQGVRRQGYLCQVSSMENL